MSRTDKELLPFLPGAIEVLQTPPPGASRVLAWTIALVFGVAVLWACLAKVDTVVVAAGELIPDGQIKSIQPLRTGAIAAVHVEEGQVVTAGDLLLTLATDELETQHASVSVALRRSIADQARATALNAAAQRTTPQIRPVAFVPTRQDTHADARGRGEWAAYQATLAGLQAQTALARANHQKATQALAKTAALLPLMREREASLAVLLEKSAIARPEWLRAREALTSLEHDQYIRATEVEEARETLLVRTRALDEHRAHTRAAWLREQHAAEKQTDQLRHELARLQILLRQSQLRAPVSGTIAQLAVHTIGGVVTTASEVMRIVPEGVRLSAEVQVRNRDIGFVNPADRAVVKLDSFPFIRHGTLDARIVHIANVSTVDPQGGEALFMVRLHLDRQHMYVGDQPVSLAAGMQLSADIKTGRRRVIEFLLEPVTRGFGEALRER